MLWLLLGIALWWAVHLFKRVMPDQRAALAERFGDASKGIVAGVILVSVILMVIGFRGANFIYVYDPPSWGRHLNNLLMIVAVVLFGVPHSKSRLRAKMRHPMLLGMATWSFAHLLVNGDLHSIILFGSMLIWSFVSILMINRAEPLWTPWQGGSKAGDIRLGIISAVVFMVIVTVHTWLGYWPFPG